MGRCDKCGKTVEPSNSAYWLEARVTGRFIGFVKDRHLYPVDGCEGSPSRVNLIKKDPLWAKAFQELQQEFAADKK